MIETTPNVTQIAAKPTAKTITSGNFVGADHPTQGMAKIVTENGKRYLEFDRKFKSDNGPDLFVLLHAQQQPRSYKKENYVSLGRLQNVKGKQRYEIPADVDLNAVKSAVIWCRQFNVTFGFAALG
ncbi:DM13 domain-containing protein [filamentous cyanobacterium LEGE 11480]|uniref:DM13 domain-containing protein n=2 Tax=Romeriopsis TaxID=2992131 RepID=A0A928VGM2_9CYAN|nr:DM13 domain-containing protein [Romeriopsis navalis LEGE 11480]